jgi:kanamycin nucleotidyltransferase
MNHEERWQVAQEICGRLVDRYGDQIRIGGVYGSTARGTDTPWSDLEMLFVVDDGSDLQGQHLFFQGTAVGYRVYRQGELEAILTEPTLRWPFHMGTLSALQVLHGDPAQVACWLELGALVPREKFVAALKDNLPGLVVESHGRLHSSVQRQETEALIPAVLEVLFEMKTALCLLNQRWTTHDYYQGLVDTFAFPLLPEGYEELLPTLYHSRDPEEIIYLADRLVERFWRLMDREGVRVKDYATVREIPV